MGDTLDWPLGLSEPKVEVLACYIPESDDLAHRASNFPASSAWDELLRCTTPPSERLGKPKDEIQHDRNHPFKSRRHAVLHGTLKAEAPCLIILVVSLGVWLGGWSCGIQPATFDLPCAMYVVLIQSGPQ